MEKVFVCKMYSGEFSVIESDFMCIFLYFFINCMISNSFNSMCVSVYC